MLALNVIKLTADGRTHQLTHRNESLVNVDEN